MSESSEEYQKKLELSRRRFLQYSAAVSATMFIPPLLRMGDEAYATTGGGSTRIGGAYPWETGMPIRFGVFNVVTGNATFEYPIVTSDALDFHLFHNSKSTAASGPLGAKWSHTFLLQIVPGSGIATYVAGDGTPYIFTLSGSSYVAPTGVWRTLVKNVDGTWDLTKRDGSNYYHFISSGRLDSIRKVVDGTVVMQCTYDGSGNLTQVANGSASISLGYTGGLITSVTDPYGKVHTLVYTSGKLTQHQLPALSGVVSHTAFAYNASGILDQITDTGGQVWGYGFDTSGNLTSTTDPSSGVSNFAVASFANLSVRPMTTSTTPGAWPSNVSTVGGSTGTGSILYGFDASSRLVATQGDVANRAVYAYDTHNNLTSKQLANGGTWAWTYDSQGRILTSAMPSGPTETFAFDGSGRVSTISRAGANLVTLGYNSSSQLTQITANGMNPINAAYDTDGNLTSISYTSGGVTSQVVYYYTTDGNVSQIQNASGYSLYLYYTNKLLTQRTDELGRVTMYARDDWGRITTESFPTTGNSSLSWSYNALGYLSAATTPAGSFTYGYDTYGDVTSVAGPYGTVSAAFTAPTLQQQYVQDTASRRHTYTWNTSGCVTSIALNDGTGTIQYAYNSNNQVSTCTLPNGIRVEFGYDANSQLTSVTHRVVSTSAVLASYSATISSSTGQVSQVTEGSGAVTTLGYDAYGRITSDNRTGSNPYASAYTYSAEGFVLTAVRSENGVASHNGSYTYINSGLLSQVVDTVTGITEAYNWNADRTLGSFTGPGYLRRLTYNEDRRLIAISRDYGGGTVVLAYEYAYDPDGLLITVKDHIAGLLTAFVSGIGLTAGDLLIVKQQPLAGGTWTEIGRYVNGLDRVVAVSGTYYHQGFTGGPFLATSSSGASTGTCAIDAFGIFRLGTGSLATVGQLPSRLVHDGVTISLPSGGASILERRLVIA